MWMLPSSPSSFSFYYCMCGRQCIQHTVHFKDNGPSCEASALLPHPHQVRDSSSSYWTCTANTFTCWAILTAFVSLSFSSSSSCFSSHYRYTWNIYLWSRMYILVLGLSLSYSFSIGCPFVSIVIYIYIHREAWVRAFRPQRTRGALWLCVLHPVSTWLFWVDI